MVENKRAVTLRQRVHGLKHELGEAMNIYYHGTDTQGVRTTFDNVYSKQRELLDIIEELILVVEDLATSIGK